LIDNTDIIHLAGAPTAMALKQVVLGFWILSGPLQVKMPTSTAAARAVDYVASLEV
jgi:hypothetical protein